MYRYAERSNKCIQRKDYFAIFSLSYRHVRVLYFNIAPSSGKNPFDANGKNAAQYNLSCILAHISESRVLM